MAARLMFFFVFVLCVFLAVKVKTNSDRKYLFMFALSALAVFGSLAFLLSGISQPGASAAVTHYFINGRHIGSDRYGLPVVPILILISAVLSLLCIWKLADAIVWTWKTAARKQKYTVWSCCNLLAFFGGVIPLLYTRRAFKDSVDNPDEKMLKITRAANYVLSLISLSNIFRLFVLA